MELLHRQAFFYEAFCGDAAKYEAHLAMHEAALRAMKQILTASFRHSERHFELKTSEFRCEMKF